MSVMLPRPVTIVTAPHAFSTASEVITVTEGATIAEIVAEAPKRGPIQHFKVWVDGRVVEPEVWSERKPPAGSMVVVRAIAADPSGKGKNPLAMILQVAVLAASFLLPPLLLGSTLAGTALIGSLTYGQALGAVIGLGGMLALKFLVPPAVPKLPSSGGSSQTYSLTGASNTLNRYGIVGEVLGRTRVYPMYAGTPYTELVGKDQWLRVMFLIGKGPITVSELKIGETPIESFPDCEIEIREGRPDDAPRRLYTRDIDETPLQIELVHKLSSFDWYERASEPDADELSVDVSFPAGLIRIDGSGDRYSRNVGIPVEYRPIAGGDWVSAGTIQVEARTSEVIRRGLRWAVTRGQYMVRMRKIQLDIDPDDGNGSNLVYWTVLRTIHARDALLEPNSATVALRMKASEHANGTLDEFNCVAQLHTLDWDHEAEEWVEAPTSNPASLIRRVLQGPSNMHPLGDSRLDLGNLEDFHDHCRINGFTFNAYYDSKATVDEVYRAIAACGRAAPAKPNGKWGVAIDRPQAVPRSLITPRNSFGLEGTRIFAKEIDAVRFTFRNKLKGWEQDERIIFADGKDANNAVEYAPLEQFGIDDPDLAWRFGRFHLAQFALRPESFTVQQGIEQIVYGRGDLVLVGHDVLLVNLAHGRIVGITLDDPEAETPMAIALTVDEQLIFEPGKSYALQIRTIDDGIITCGVVNPAGVDTIGVTTVALEDPVDAAMLADPMTGEGGDLWTFRESAVETLDCIVTDVANGEDGSARISFVEAAPAIHAADTGPIPAHDSRITHAGSIERAPPVAPVVQRVRSDESVLVRATDGTLQSRILIDLVLPLPGLGAPPVWVQAQIRESGTDEWRSIAASPAEAGQVSIFAVDDGETYDVDLWYVSGPGFGSKPSKHTLISGHFVVGKTTPPPGPTGAWRLEDGRISWSLPGAMPPDFYGARIKAIAGVATTPAGALPIHNEVVVAQPYDPRHVGFGTWTLFIFLVDVAENESLDYARMVIDFGEATAANVVETQAHAPAWDIGNIVSGEVSGGSLRGVSSTLFWTANPARKIWTGNPSAPFWGTGGFGDVEYRWTYTPAEAARLLIQYTLDAPQGWSLQWVTQAEADALIFWTGVDDATWWTGEDSAVWWGAGADGLAMPWRAWPGAALVNVEPYLFVLRIAGGAAQQQASALTMVLDVEDLVLKFNDIAVGPSGYVLDLGGRFRLVTNIQLTLEDDGGAGFKAGWSNKNGSPGPTLTVLDVAGLPTSGTVDAMITGARA